MSYYWFNREEVLKKTNEKYHNKGGKEKAVQSYKDNKEAIKKQETCKKNWQKKKKNRKGNIQEIGIIN